MPRLVKGAKWTYGWVIVGPAREITIPPDAWREFGFQTGGGPDSLAKALGRCYNWPMPNESFTDTLLVQIVQLMREIGTPAYLVGGAVRDELLKAQQFAGAGQPYKVDLDFAVPGDGLRAARRIADALGGAYYPLDPKRGVGRAVRD